MPDVPSPAALAVVDVHASHVLSLQLSRVDLSGPFLTMALLPVTPSGSHIWIVARPCDRNLLEG